MTSDQQATRARWGAVAVALAPAVMAFALTAHPFIERLPDAGAVAQAVEGGATWWGAIHLVTAVGAGLIMLAFLAVRAYLRAAGEDRYSAWALPWVILGSVMYAFLPGLEFAPLAATGSGGDPAAMQKALEPWFVPVLQTSALVFAVGVIGFARAVLAAEGLLSGKLTAVVVTALVTMALSRLVPFGAVQFYVQAVAGLAAMWPLAFQMWSSPVPSAPSHQAVLSDH
ncbi:MAG: hypothetical protein WB508_12280 [Aeromicrobium sp.]|uniref:hypothetical protein n=1 Tax=Aeromicrobium sp. TaxID=1871063 RepID=UPI003C605EA9